MQIFADAAVGDTGVCRDHHIAFRVFFKVTCTGFAETAAAFQNALGVADAGGHAEQHRAAEFFCDFIGFDQEIVGFLAVGGFKHGDGGGDRVAAVVLFILAGSHAGIVGGDDDQTARSTAVSDGEERVGGDVQTDMFHRDQTAAVGISTADRHFESGLFVGSPFGRAAQLTEFIKDLGGGGAGIADAPVDSAVISGVGDGLVAAGKQTL